MSDIKSNLPPDLVEKIDAYGSAMYDLGAKGLSPGHGKRAARCGELLADLRITLFELLPPKATR